MDKKEQKEKIIPDNIVKSEINLNHDANNHQVEDYNDDKSSLVSELADMPPEIRREITAQFGAMVSSSRQSHPLFDKFNDSHIDKYLDYMQKDDDNEYAFKKSNRWFYLVYFIIVVFVIIIAVYGLLPNHQDFLEQIFTIIIMVLGGVGIGYGLKKRE